MAPHRRTHRDTLVKLLEASIPQATPSRIWYRVATSGTLVYQAIKTAKLYGLLEHDGEHYKTTGKGMQFLKAWAQAMAFLEEE